jgi:hypothetical protein
MTMLSITPRMYFAHWQSGHRSFAVDALMALTLVLVMFAMIALIALLGSAEPGTAAANVADGAGMLILPP